MNSHFLALAPPPFPSQVRGGRALSERELRYRRGLLTMSLSSQSVSFNRRATSSSRHGHGLSPEQFQTAQTMRTRSPHRPLAAVFAREISASVEPTSTARKDCNVDLTARMELTDCELAKRPCRSIDRSTDRSTDRQPHFGGSCQCFLRIV